MTEMAKLIDNATGEPPVLEEGDTLVTMGEPKRAGGELRQLCEVRRALPVEQAEVAVYDAMETLRGRVEVAGLGTGGEARGSLRMRGQRLRQAAKVVSACVDNLARAIESAK